MQPSTSVCVLASKMFQSSPVPEDGCNPAAAMYGLARRREGFNPHPSRRTGATYPNALRKLVVGFQSSPVPEDGCNRLTQYGIFPGTHVSILTRPGGRVQRRAQFRLPFRRGFQSSPVPEDGCNDSLHPRRTVSHCFNPHPSRRTGATIPNRLPQALGRRRSFNPHPSRRTGAT